MTERDLCDKIKRMRPVDVAAWLGAAQYAYESHGGMGPCPCWMCETRRSLLRSINVQFYEGRAR